MIITFNNLVDTLTLDNKFLIIPLTETILENTRDVTTLDYNLYTDFINTKRQYVIRFSPLKKSDYETIRSFYDRQFIDYLYPTVTIEDYNFTDVPVRMYINDRSVEDDCGIVIGFEITIRESVQLSSGVL